MTIRMCRIFTLALLLVVPAAVPAADAPEAESGGGSSGDVPRIEFEKHVLPNGLQLILHVDRKLPFVHVNQWFHVGSKDEKPGRTGFAHLFEHMMFQGSRNADDDYFVNVERAGANLIEGGVNGTTNQDRTNYFATVPSANLEFLLWLESDRLATLLDATTQEKLDNQRDVVKNERRQGLDNVPYGRWYELLVSSLHPAGHPYSWPVIGSMEDLSAASLDDVGEFFRRFYTPNNLSLVIAGDFDPAEARRLVEKYFGGLAPGPALERHARNVPALASERVIEVADRVPQERVYLAWPAPGYFTQDDAALELAAQILGDGLSSRLNRTLVYDRELCTAVQTFVLRGEIASAFIVIATARPGASLAEIESVVSAEIATLAESGPTEAEVARARTKYEMQFISQLDRIGGFGGKADLLNQYNIYLGDPGRVEEDLGRFRSASVDDVGGAVGRWLDTPNRVAIRFRPAESGRPDEVALDRAEVPELGEDRHFTAPEVAATQLDNGLEVFVVERSEVPKVFVSLATRAGAAADPEGKDGLASMTVRSIDMGTDSLQALEIEEALGDLGVTLSGSTGRDHATLGFEVLSRQLSEALGIVADVVRNPTFPVQEIARERQRQLDTLAQQERNANAVAARVRAMLAFGPDHPYGRPVQGLPRTVEGITRDDIAGFHHDYWRPGGSALVLVGDVTLDDAVELAREHLGDWQGEAPSSAPVPPAAPATGGRIYLVDRQDAAQTAMSLVLPGAPARGADDYHALELVDAVWGGGGFGTRLNLNLREDKGYSYGVFSTLASYRDAGYWFAGGGVQTDKTSESAAEFRIELDGLAGVRPITKEEFEAARIQRLRGYAQQFESYGRIAGQVATLWSLGLPMTSLQGDHDGAEGATLEAVREAAARYVDAGGAFLLLVGDRTQVEPGLRELATGAIVLLDSEGRPVGEDAPVTAPGLATGAHPFIPRTLRSVPRSPESRDGEE